LVEIESSVRQVFKGGILGNTEFHHLSRQAIDQVRSWREILHLQDSRNELLSDLRSLFERYPIEIFTSDSAVHPRTSIEIGYVLVVGSERPRPGHQQKLIEDLYLQEKILMMTYPMMIEQVEKTPRTKHMLVLKKKVTETLAVDHTKIDFLLAKVPSLPYSVDLEGHTIDPFGVELGGLGWKLEGDYSRLEATHPESMKEIYYRSGGNCEYHNCFAKIMVAGKICGDISSIYNLIESEGPAGINNTNRVGMFCLRHCWNCNDGNRVSMRQHHPLLERLSHRKPYTPSLDAELSAFLAERKKGWINRFLTALEIDEQLEPSMAKRLTDWLQALASLPYLHALTLLGLVRAYFGLDMSSWRWSRSVDRLAQDPRCRYLLQAGLIRVNQSAPYECQLEPTVFESSFIDRLKRRFPERHYFVLHDICRTQIESLERNVAREGQKA
jgi:hypothetical protein